MSFVDFSGMVNQFQPVFGKRDQLVELAVIAIGFATGLFCHFGIMRDQVCVAFKPFVTIGEWSVWVYFSLRGVDMIPLGAVPALNHWAKHYFYAFAVNVAYDFFELAVAWRHVKVTIHAGAVKSILHYRGNKAYPWNFQFGYMIHMLARDFRREETVSSIVAKGDTLKSFHFGFPLLMTKAGVIPPLLYLLLPVLIE